MAILAGTSLTFIPTRPYAPVAAAAGVVARGSGPWTVWRDPAPTVGAPPFVAAEVLGAGR